MIMQQQNMMRKCSSVTKYVCCGKKTNLVFIIIVIIRAHSFPQTILPNSAGQFANSAADFFNDIVNLHNYIIMSMIVPITGHFSISAKFHGNIILLCSKRQIPRLGLKFCSRLKTMGPNHHLRLCLLKQHHK